MSVWYLVASWDETMTPWNLFSLTLQAACVLGKKKVI